MNFASSGSAIHGSFASRNVASGITVKGDGSTIDAVQTSTNDAGDAIRVGGNGQHDRQQHARWQWGRGHPSEPGRQADDRQQRLQQRPRRHRRIRGTAVSPNVIGNSVSAANGESGIFLTGNGSGADGGADLKGGTPPGGNGSDGIQVNGSGHKLKNNSSGGSGSDTNRACEYRATPGYINAAGNTIGSVAIPGANGSPFITGCI